LSATPQTEGERQRERDRERERESGRKLTLFQVKRLFALFHQFTLRLLERGRDFAFVFLLLLRSQL